MRFDDGMANKKPNELMEPIRYTSGSSWRSSRPQVAPVGSKKDNGTKVNL
jgi:hypothetical protein